MDIGMLAYKIHKRTVVVKDYIAWAQKQLHQGISSPSIAIIAAMTSDHNVFEVEHYFNRALQELQLELPAIVASSRATIACLAAEILSEENEVNVFQLAHEIFKIVMELQYPEDLLEWYNISEMQDRLTYDAVQPDFTKADVFHKIKHEARKSIS